MSYLTNSRRLFTDEELVNLREKQIQIKLDNEKYIAKHPELKAIISDLIAHLLEERPL
ncbi:hypothetical protein KIPB_014554, partial [Kipferlia bialata]|eukprot:g14554.t1